MLNFNAKKNLIKQIDQVQGEKQELINSLNALETKNKQLVAALNKELETVEDFRYKIKAQKYMLETAKEINAAIVGQCEELNEECKALDKRNKELYDERQQAVLELQEARKLTSMMQDERNKLQEKSDYLENKVDLLAKQIVEKRKSNIALKERNESLQKENEKLRQTLKNNLILFEYDAHPSLIKLGKDYTFNPFNWDRAADVANEKIRKAIEEVAEKIEEAKRGK